MHTTVAYLGCNGDILRFTWDLLDIVDKVIEFIKYWDVVIAKFYVYILCGV